MPSLVLCYAPEDDAAARALGGYIEANLDYQVCYGECVVGADLDLIEAADRALSAEAALLLLSPHSVPPVWNRQKWEPVLFGNPDTRSLLGFVLVADCRFPELFRRHCFFDARTEPRVEARRIRQWLLRPEQPLPRELGFCGTLAPLADLPGVASEIPHADAIRFAQECARDFEAVCIFDFAQRSRAGILGDIGHGVGLSLPGTVKENREALERWCAFHRVLLVISNVAPEDAAWLSFGGRASVLLTCGAPAPDHAPEQDIGAAFLTEPRDASRCAPLVADAVLHLIRLLASDFSSALRLGWAIVSFAREANRFAEAIELLDRMEAAARRRGDAMALYRIEREQSWLRDSSPAGETICILPTAAPGVAQLSLQFA